MNSQNKYPPIHVWAMTLVIVCVVAVSSFYYFQTSFIQYNTKRLHLLSSVNGKRIVGLGTSLLRRATFFDEFMSDFGRENGFDGFKFVQITKGGGLQDDFISLMQTIEETKPNVVLIESNLVFLDLVKSEKLKVKIISHRDYLKSIFLKSLRFFAGSNSWYAQPTRELPFKPVTQDSMRFVSKIKLMRKYEVRDTTLTREFEDFLIYAREQKTKIIVVEVPRYEKLEEVVTELPKNKQKLSALIQDLKTKYGIEYLEYPEKLGLEYYVDFSHFNQKGRERYSLWLLSCLSKF